MSRRSSEYRGKPLKELEGKTHFTCEITKRKLSILQLELHHISPQAAGGADIHDRSNILLVASDTHDIVHVIADSMAGLSKKKRSARELAQEYAETVVPADQVPAVVESLLQYAAIVAAAIAQKKNRLIEGGDVVVSIELPPRFNSAFKLLAKTIRDGNGKRIGKERLAKWAVLNLIATKHSALAPEINDYVLSEILHTVTTQPKTALPNNISPRKL